MAKGIGILKELLLLKMGDCKVMQRCLQGQSDYMECSDWEIDRVWHIVVESLINLRRGRFPNNKFP
jgi:hypothetical protein